MKNKPLSVAGISELEDNAKGKRQLWNFDEKLSAGGIILRYTSKPERGFVYFITFRIISQGERT